MLSSSDNGRNTGCYASNPDTQTDSNLPQKFTGKERDPETRLDYFGARYYSAAQGRFSSADWSSKPTAVPYADFRNPQTLNLYSYLQNNPLSSVDADGHCGNNDWCDSLKGLATGTWSFAKNTVVGTAQLGWASATKPMLAGKMLIDPLKVAYPARIVPNRRYDSDEEFRQNIYTAEPQTARYTLRSA